MAAAERKFEGTRKGGLRSQGLHFRASSLDTSLAGWCHHRSAALRFLLTLATCCFVVLMDRAEESVWAMSSTFPRDEGHTRTHKERLLHTAMELYRKLCSHVRSHKPICLQLNTRKEHTWEHNGPGTLLRIPGHWAVLGRMGSNPSSTTPTPGEATTTEH